MIKEYLQSFNILTDDEIEHFVNLTTQKTIVKGDYFIRESETCKEVAFILSGIFRSYYILSNGEQITYCITFPHTFITAYSSFITGQGTPENIQALTPVELMLVSKDNLDQLASKNNNWMKLLKVMAEQQYIELEKRIFQLQATNAAQRYRDLINNQPEYIQEIPLQYLASFLGITQRHLSRIRKEISF